VDLVESRKSQELTHDPGSPERRDPSAAARNLAEGAISPRPSTVLVRSTTHIACNIRALLDARSGTIDLPSGNVTLLL
jgi:hypothetical protein